MRRFRAAVFKEAVEAYLLTVPKMPLVSFEGILINIVSTRYGEDVWVYADPIMDYLQIPVFALTVYVSQPNIKWNWDLQRLPGLKKKARFVTRAGFLEIMKHTSPDTYEFRRWMLNSVYGTLEHGKQPKSYRAGFFQRCKLYFKNK